MTTTITIEAKVHRPGLVVVEARNADGRRVDWSITTADPIEVRRMVTQVRQFHYARQTFLATELDVMGIDHAPPMVVAPGQAALDRVVADAKAARYTDAAATGYGDRWEVPAR